MNKAYRVIWSGVRNCYVVTSELAKKHKKSTANGMLHAVVSAGLIISAGGQVFAAPSNPVPGEGPGIAVGAGSKAKSESAVAIGADSVAEDEDAVAMGHGAVSRAKGALAFGKGAETGKEGLSAQHATDSIAMGTSAKALGKESIAIGKGSHSDGQAVVIGSEAKSETTDPASSVVIGYKASTKHGNTVAIGGEAKAEQGNGIAIGVLSRVQGHGGIAIGGVGSLLKPIDAPNLGSRVPGAAALGQTSMALGPQALATGDSSVALGLVSHAAGEDAIAIGELTYAGTLAYAAGYGTRAVGTGSLAQGMNSAATGEGALAFGAYAVSVGSPGFKQGGLQGDSAYGTAIGGFSFSGGYGAALGFKAEANGYGSLALGAGAAVGLEDIQAITDKNVENYLAGNEEIKNIIENRYASELKKFENDDRHKNKVLAGFVREYLYAKKSETLGTMKGTSVGFNTTVSVPTGVALGANSIGDRAGFTAEKIAPFSKVDLNKITQGAVSVGREDGLRQIINLADGTEDTDAVNIRQLKGLEEKIKEEMPTGNSSVTKAGDYVTVTEETKNKVTTYTVSGPKLISPDATIKITDLQDDKGNKTGYQLSVDSTKLNIRADTHVKEGVYQVGEITLADGKKTTGVTMAIVDQDGKNTGKSVIISDVASKTYVDNEIANINTKIDGAKVNIKAGDNVTIKEDTAKKTYTISATDTKLKGNTNALSMNGTTLNLSLEDTAGTKVTGSVDLKAIQSAVDTNTTYAMTGTKNDDNTTTITLKGSDGKEQKVTVATKDNDTYTTGGTYDKDTKKITFNRNDNKTYDVDLSDLADGIISAVDVVKSGEITEQGKIKLYKDDEKTKVIELEGTLKDASVKAGTYAVGKENTVILDMKDNYSGKDLAEKVTIKDVAKASDVGNIYQFHKNVLNADGSKTTVVDAINNIDTRVTNIRKDVNVLGDRLDGVGAGAAALAALHPLDFDPDDKWDFAASYGRYHSRNAYALGAYYRPNEDTMFSIGGTVGSDEDMLNAGISIKLGQGNHVSTSRVAMAKEIKELRAIVEKQNGQIQKLAALVMGHDAVRLSANVHMEFPDVPKNHWAYEYVQTLADRGLIAGYPDGEFKGGRQMTRYEFAAVIYRALQNGAVVDGQMTRAVAEFAPELEKVKLAEYFRIDTVMADGKGNPKIQRVRVSVNN